jgi:predicted MFS family arabinose efflux permease
MNRPLVLAFACSFGAGMSFYLLLSVVPLFVTSVGASGTGAGLVTGALMLSTVAAELTTPRLVARFGVPAGVRGGLLLLGAPALALTASTGMGAIVAVCIVRGLGFGIAVVIGSALVGMLVPPERRGEGLGIHGIVVGVPTVVALPLGVWLAGFVGYPLVFVAAAVAALAGLAAFPGLSALPGRQPKRQHSIGVLAGLRTLALVRPSVVFSATTVAAGIVVTFLPLAVTPAFGNLAAVALSTQAAVATLSRWWAGRRGDKYGPGGLLAPGVLACALGMLALVLIPTPAAVLAGMVLFGAGFGVAQNASLAVMFNRVPSSGYGAVSALWNLAYDAGLGLGAIGFGALTAGTGYPAGFALTAAVALAAVLPARRDRAARPAAR